MVYYNNNNFISMFYTDKNISFDLSKIKDGSNILMLGMGGLYFPLHRLPNCNYTVIEYDWDIINLYSNRITDNVKVIKDDIYDIKLEEKFDYMFIDIFIEKAPISTLYKIQDLFKDNVDKENMFHLISIFK